MSDQETAPDLADDVAELEAFASGGGFWRLAPEWVPRMGYVASSPGLLAAVRDGLLRRL